MRSTCSDRDETYGESRPLGENFGLTPMNEVKHYQEKVALGRGSMWVQVPAEPSSIFKNNIFTSRPSVDMNRVQIPPRGVCSEKGISSRFDWVHGRTRKKPNRKTHLVKRPRMCSRQVPYMRIRTSHRTYEHVYVLLVSHSDEKSPDVAHVATVRHRKMT